MFTVVLGNMVELTSQHLSTEDIESEEKLIKAAQKNPRDFEPLYKKYFERIAKFVYHRLDDKDLAFEITSNVFYNALKNLSKYKLKGVPFSAWLFRIAANELNQWFRKNKSQRTVSIDTVGLRDLKCDMEETDSAELDHYLFEALQELEDDEMELINMRFFEKRSFKEISDINTIGESACKMRIYRILEKLKVKLTCVKD
jgi:RNA polymerase sigma-70 factor (ECF subfamily)